MGEAATRLADTAVLTSDNPRGEDPDAIAAEVMAGVVPSADEVRAAGRLLVEPDRRQAISLALGRAGDGDVVVVAGKGHETTQEVAGALLPFDDRAVVAELLGAGPGPSGLGNQRG
jgi:UDP-N-acetylmuramoyl-L-alanyl-D-glutamate--2,6-diaminopimelate ligase